MKGKTCGECKHYNAAMFHCEKHDAMAEPHNTCEDCTAKTITKGDRIIACRNAGIAAFVCGVLNDRSENTFRKLLDFLNAPAESEGEDE